MISFNLLSSLVIRILSRARQAQHFQAICLSHIVSVRADFDFYCGSGLTMHLSYPLYTRSLCHTRNSRAGRSRSLVGSLTGLPCSG